MVKSLSMMNNVGDVCSEHRERLHGQNAQARDYKDSFIINECIECFKGNPEDLLDDKITELDQSQSKTSKSVNLRSDCYEKLCNYAKLLSVPESEVCRRILYYMLGVEVDKSADAAQLSTLKGELLLLQKQIEAGLQTLTDIMKKIEEN